MKLNQLTIKTRLPDWRASMPVFAMPEAPLQARRAAARKLGDSLKPGTLRGGARTRPGAGQRAG